MREIARDKLTGSLYLLNASTKKVVFFEDGRPIFVRSNVLSECLGQVLSQEGLITSEQCDQTLEAIRRTGKKQGELLVEMGILSEGNLRYGLEAQLRIKIYDIFSWSDGRYQFKHDAHNLQFGVRLELCCEAVIIDAIQDTYGDTRAVEALAGLGAKYLRRANGKTPAPSELELMAEEQYFLECLDGSQTVQHYIERPPVPGIPTPSALVYALLQAGVVSCDDKALPAQADPTPPELDKHGVADSAFVPTFEAHDVLTEYEDTPIPGELPQSRALLGDHEADFEGVDDLEPSSSGPKEMPRPEVSEELVAAEPASVDETFDEDQLKLDDDDVEELDDDAFSFADLNEPEDDGQLGDTPDAGSPAEHAYEAAALSVLDEVAPAPSEPQPEVAAAPPQQPAILVEAQPDAGPPQLVPPSQAEPDPISAPIPAPDPIPEVDAIPEVGAIPEPDPIPEPGAIPVPDVPDAIPVPGAIPAVDADRIADSAPSLEQQEAAAVSQTLADPIGPLPPQDDEADVDDGLLDLAELDDVDLGSELMAAPAAHSEGLDEIEELELDPDASGAGPLGGSASDDGLMSFDDLDEIDLGGAAPAPPNLENLGPGTPALGARAPGAPAPGAPAPGANGTHSESEATFRQSNNPEVLGAMRFNEAESALSTGDFPGAVALLEEAYDNGFDVAELHAMLAYSRFMAAGKDSETAAHAFELLEYAQNMDPSLDLTHAYRGAIHQGLGSADKARDSLSRALELNPYCDLAIQLMDQLSP